MSSLELSSFKMFFIMTITVMLEAEANNVPSALLEKALDFGVKHGQTLASRFRSMAKNKCLTSYTPLKESFTDLSE